MKMTLLGPTYPFRGGIAHYTTLLCRALREKNEVRFISFRRQYPSILFPGKSDRDPSKKPLKLDNVEYLLDPFNPYTWLLVSRTIKKYRPEKIVIPWWVTFWTPQFWSILTILKACLHSEIVMICHNVVEHETNIMKRMATKAVLSRADRFITHSKEDTRRLKNLLGEFIDVVTAFHPTYADLDKNKYTKQQSKETLGLIGPVLLFFGFIREYKGLGVLLKAMEMVTKHKNVNLLVVGEFWKDKQLYLETIDRYGLSAKVRIVDQYVPNEKVGVYFAASDLVVQPYLSASGSGVAQLAYGFNRPVIATNVGSLPEVVEDGMNGRIVEPGDIKGLANAILESLETETLLKLSQNAMETKNKFSWDKMAEIVSNY